MFWWRTSRGEQSLLVRDCYGPMFEKVWSHNVNQAMSGTVVLGNPGIGKTGFLWWSLWKLLRAKQRIIIKLPTSRKYVCVDGYSLDAPVVRQHEALPEALLQGDDGPWYLADKKIPEEDWTLPCKFLLTCSPLKANYFEFAKASAVVKLYDRVWTLSELLALNQHSFRHPSVDVEQRFKRWGGIPRYVLDKIDPGSQMELEAVIGTVRDADQIMRLQGLPEDQSHRVFHMTVNESNYATYRLSLATAYVSERVFANLPMPSLRCLISTPQPESIRDIQGKLLEYFLIDKIIPGGAKLQYRDLQSDGSFGPVGEDRLPKVHVRHDLLYKGGGGREAVFPSHPLPPAHRTALFKPWSARNGEWDFVAHGAIFQVTVAGELSLQLGQATRAALEFLRSFPGCDKQKITFYILVPCFNLSTFSIDWFDTVKPDKGVKKKRSQKELPGVIQQVMGNLDELNVNVRLASARIGDVCPTCLGEGILDEGLHTSVVHAVDLLSAAKT